MKAFAYGIIMLIVGAVIYALMSGAVDVSFSIQLQYDSLHDAVQMASK